MKNKLCISLLISLLSIIMCVPVFAEDMPSEVETSSNTQQTIQFQDVTFSMPIPEGTEINGSIYVIYKGNSGDIFLELNEDNNFTQTAPFPMGAYYIYQILGTIESENTYLSTEQFVVSDFPAQGYIYIRNENGLINESLIPGEKPTSLMEFGPEIARKEENKQRQQYEQNYEQITEEKVNNGTQDVPQPTSNNTGFKTSTIIIIIIGIITIIGLLLASCMIITVRKEKKTAARLSEIARKEKEKRKKRNTLI